MWRLILCALAALPGLSLASPTLEQSRSSISVEYGDSARAAVRCSDVGECSLELFHHGRRRVIPAAALDGLVLVPNALALLEYTESGRSVVQVEVGCADYAVVPPEHVCIGQLTFEGSELKETLVIKRTLLDTWDAKPLRAGS